ncbi:hypothetical protein ACFLSA_04200 [Bacteroidota bacterium]
MIKYLKHSEIDIVKWDSCIHGARNSMVYARSWYLDIVSPQWDALIYNDYEAVMPLTWKKKVGIKYLSQPFLTQQLGIFSKSVVSSDVVNEFLSLATSKYRLVDIHLNSYSEIKKEEVRKYVNQELNLNRNYDDLHREYSKSNAKNLKIALKTFTDISESDDSATFVKNYEEYSGKRIHGLSNKHYRIMKNLIDKSMNIGIGKIFSIVVNDKIAASVFYLFDKDRIIQLIAYSSPVGRNKKSMFALIDSIIGQHAGTNLIYDFEGSGIKGIHEFNKGFGATSTKYYHLYINKLPFLIKVIKAIQEKFS